MSKAAKETSDYKTILQRSFEVIIQYKDLALLRWIKEDMFRYQDFVTDWRNIQNPNPIRANVFYKEKVNDSDPLFLDKPRKNYERYGNKRKIVSFEKDMWEIVDEAHNDILKKWNAIGKTEANKETAKNAGEAVLNRYIKKLQAKISGKDDGGDLDGGKVDEKLDKGELIRRLEEEIRQLGTRQLNGGLIYNASTYNNEPKLTKDDLEQKRTLIWSKNSPYDWSKLDKKIGGVELERWKIALEKCGITKTGFEASTKGLRDQFKIIDNSINKFRSLVKQIIDAKDKAKDPNVPDITDDILAAIGAPKINKDSGTTDGGGGGGSDTVEYGYGVVEHKTFWYISFGNLIHYANDIIDKFEKEYTDKYSFPLFRFICKNNQTEYNGNVKSCYPVDVYFPDKKMGSYGSFQPFNTPEFGEDVRICRHWRYERDAQGNTITENNRPKEGYVVLPDVINIGEILIGVDYIRKTYRNFFVENATNISLKNITSFFEEIIKGINAASGDIYQLTAVVFEEPERLSNSLHLDAIEPASAGETGTKRRAFISIEDSNLAKRNTIRYYEGDEIDEREDEQERRQKGYSVRPFYFEGNIMKPLIRNLNIVSRPPKEATFAAYIAARGQEANNTGEKKAPPISSDVNLGFPEYKDLEKHKKLKAAADVERLEIESQAANSGFNERWSDEFRGALIKMKRLTTEPDQVTDANYKIGAHWLNQCVYPIQLTLTIDGINGFKFGDVIKTTLIPRHYNVNWDIVFTVTKIEHKVTVNSWETTLHTAARLSLDSPLTGISTVGSRTPVTAPSSTTGVIR